jgi:hypothetical protein
VLLNKGALCDAPVGVALLDREETPFWTLLVAYELGVEFWGVKLLALTPFV